MVKVDMSKSKSSSRTSSPSEEMANSTKIETASGDKESTEQKKLLQSKDDSAHSENEARNSSNKCRTSFSVDDILSPSKFNGQMSSLTPEYFMRWQPWLMQEALRQNCPFPDLALSFYKPFFMNPKDG